MILTADWHLTDNPADEYRWAAFDELNALLDRIGSMTRVFILGDLCDRKDKHSAALTNRLVEALMNVHQNAWSIDIIMGNHDEPLRGVPYWDFLNYIRRDRLRFHSTPKIVQTTRAEALLFPFTPDPVGTWAALPNKDFKAVFMHQPVDGAISESGRAMTGHPMPIFPRGMTIYSGDIHTPQKVGRVQYVGAPHHVKFGDEYKCRMLILDDGFSILQEIELSPPRKALVHVSTMSELSLADVKPGDQVKLRFDVDPADMASWPRIEAEAIAWAEKRGVRLSSMEAIVGVPSGTTSGYAGDADPLLVFDAFTKERKTSSDLVSVGISLLKEAITNA